MKLKAHNIYKKQKNYLQNNNDKIKAVLGIILLSALLSCGGGEVTDYSGEKNVPAAKPEQKDIDMHGSSTQPVTNQLHTVVVDEVLPAQKYVYAHVTEGAQQYWVATMKKEIEVGETYFFRGGLLKTNFESKEYNRMFDKIYLVSQFVPATHGNEVHQNAKMKMPQTKVNNTAKNTGNKTRRIETPGSVSIADLVTNPQKFEGQEVQVSGTCFKINPKIMGRNWIHLKDGSRDDYDLVITSDEFVPEGSVVTIKATVALNKDFGAGYQYDLILEDGKVVK